VAINTIPDFIYAVASGDFVISFVTIENAIEGTVHLTIDYLVHQMILPIAAEVVDPIQQNLLVHPNFSGEMDDIQEIHSHQHAIAQCQQYIHQHLSEASIYYTDST